MGAVRGPGGVQAYVVMIDKALSGAMGDSDPAIFLKIFLTIETHAWKGLGPAQKGP